MTGLRLNSAARFAVCVLAALAILGSSSCALVPGLQLTVEAAEQHSQFRVTETPDEKLVELLDGDGGVVQRFRIISLNGRNFLKYKSAADSVAEKAISLGSIVPSTVIPEYHVGPGDVLQIIVWDHPELTSPTGDFRDPVSAGRLVTADGNLYYPYVGEFFVAGKTAPQVRDLLTERLSKVITRPQVDVRIVAYRAGRVQVAGEVKEPGVVTLDDTPKGVFEAISERGGLSESASRRAVTVLRDGVQYRVSYGGMTGGAKYAVNPPIAAGDIIYVPHRDSEQVYVLGEVTSQTSIPLEHEQVSLTQILAKSGGLDKSRADDAGVLIFRRSLSADIPPEIFAINLSRPQGLLLAGEFIMEPRDVVYVKATNFAKYNSIVAQLLPTISAVFQIDALVNR